MSMLQDGDEATTGDRIRDGDGRIAVVRIILGNDGGIECLHPLQFHCVSINSLSSRRRDANDRRNACAARIRSAAQITALMLQPQ
jgi:hypothetical protein